MDITLAGIGRQIHYDQVEIRRLILPLHDDKILGRAIFPPGSERAQQLSLPFTYGGLRQSAQELFVAKLDFTLNRFLWTSAQLHRHPSPGARKLALMKKTHPRQS